MEGVKARLAGDAGWRLMAGRRSRHAGRLAASTKLRRARAPQRPHQKGLRVMTGTAAVRTCERGRQAWPGTSGMAARTRASGRDRERPHPAPPRTPHRLHPPASAAPAPSSPPASAPFGWRPASSAAWSARGGCGLRGVQRRRPGGTAGSRGGEAWAAAGWVAGAPCHPPKSGHQPSHLVLAPAVVVGAGVGVGGEREVHLHPSGGAGGRLLVALLRIQPVAGGRKGRGSRHRRFRRRGEQARGRRRPAVRAPGPGTPD